MQHKFEMAQIMYEDELSEYVNKKEKINAEIDIYEKNLKE